MTENHNVANATKGFAPLNEDDILASMVGKKIEGTLEIGKFWGILEGFSEFHLFIRGNDGRRIIVKRRKITRLMEAV